MEERGSTIAFEEVFDDEINDIWDTIFPSSRLSSNHTVGETEKAQKMSLIEPTKPRRYMQFLFM